MFWVNHLKFHVQGVSTALHVKRPVSTGFGGSSLLFAAGQVRGALVLLAAPAVLLGVDVLGLEHPTT